MRDSKFADIYGIDGIDVGELSRNIAKKKKPDVLQAYKCPLCDIYYR